VEVKVMADQIVPVSSFPNQQFQVTLEVNGQVLRLNLTIRFNEMAGYWVLTIADTLNNILVDSIPMLTGTWPAANLLKQYQYLQIGSIYIVNNTNNPTTDYPNSTNLGSDFIMIWGDNV
jgi:hypothetical protein